MQNLHAKGYHEILIVRLDLDGPDLTHEDEREREYTCSKPRRWRHGRKTETLPEFIASTIPSTIRQTKNIGRESGTR
jgi:hypothetical protein